MVTDYLMGVAPLAGAWIEITNLAIDSAIFLVAPLAGAWIEIAFWLLYLLFL